VALLPEALKAWASSRRPLEWRLTPSQSARARVDWEALWSAVQQHYTRSGLFEGGGGVLLDVAAFLSWWAVAECSSRKGRKADKASALIRSVSNYLNGKRSSDDPNDAGPFQVQKRTQSTTDDGGQTAARDKRRKIA
jgi:hypothetical protein